MFVAFTRFSQIWLVKWVVTEWGEPVTLWMKILVTVSLANILSCALSIQRNDRQGFVPHKALFPADLTNSRGLRKLRLNWCHILALSIWRFCLIFLPGWGAMKSRSAVKMFRTLLFSACPAIWLRFTDHLSFEFQDLVDLNWPEEKRDLSWRNYYLDFLYKLTKYLVSGECLALFRSMSDRLIFLWMVYDEGIFTTSGGPLLWCVISKNET